jgi:hypothetical protein
MLPETVARVGNEVIFAVDYLAVPARPELATFGLGSGADAKI